MHRDHNACDLRAIKRDVLPSNNMGPPSMVHVFCGTMAEGDTIKQGLDLR